MVNLIKDKYSIAIFLSSLICLVINFASGNSIFTTLSNVCILVILILIFKKIHYETFKKTHPIFISLLGLIPLFTITPENPNTTYVALIITLLFYFFLVSKLKILIAVFIITLIFIGNILAGNIITTPLNQINQERTIFYIKETPKQIENFQEDSLFLPYKIRSLVFNFWSPYLYNDIQRSIEIFSLKNIYTTLLLANIYPIILGFAHLRLNRKEKVLFIGSLVSMILSIGISRSPNVFGSFILVSPFIMTYLLTGLCRINKFIYLLLIILSFVLITSPVP